MDNLFVDFTAPWCGYCSKLNLELDLLTKGVERMQLPVHILRVDMSIAAAQAQALSIIERENIKGYPTLYLYESRRFVSSYNGSRTSSNMLNFLRIKLKARTDAGDTVTRINRLDEISKLVLKLNYNGMNMTPKDDADRRVDDKADDRFNSVLYEDHNNAIHEASSDNLPTDVIAVVLFLFPLAAVGSGQGVHGPLMEIASLLQYDCPWLAVRFSDSTTLVEHYGILDDSLIIFNAIDNYQYQELAHTSKYLSPNHIVIPLIDFMNEDRDQLLGSVKESIFKHMFPLTMNYDAHIQSILRLLPISTHVLVFHDPKNGNTGSEHHDQQIYRNIEAVAALHRGKMLFLYVDINQQHHVTQAFRITKKETALPSIIIVNMSDPYDMTKHRFNDFEVPVPLWNEEEQYMDMNGDEDTSGEGHFVQTICEAEGHAHPNCLAAITAYRAKNLHHEVTNPESSSRPGDFNHEPDILMFFQMFGDGILPRSLDSEHMEDIEVINQQLGYGTTSNVETIAAINFYHKVLEDHVSDVFVYFFAPWCAYCKAMEPVMEDVARYYIDEEKNAKYVQVLRINGIENEVDIPSISIQGFPAFYFFAGYSNKMEPIEYTGDRKAASIISFIDSHGINHVSNNQ
jgi:thioredoxin-like negative regulator of GroEL